MFYMYYRVIDIIWLLLLVSIPNDNYGQKISCYGDRPFKTKDINCADFSEVCIKQNDPECKSFLDTCKQCPITNTTVRTFLGLLKSSKDGLEKKIDDSVRQQKAVEEQLNHKIASLQLYGISILVLLIIVIIAISLIIFKLIKRKTLFRKRKPDHRVEMSNQTNEYESLVANSNDTHDLKLQQKFDEFLIKIKDILDPKLENNLDESIIKMADLLVKTNTKFDSFLDKHEWTEWFIEVEPIQNEKDAIKKAAEYIKHHPGLEFTGKWSTTKPMAICAINVKSLGKKNIEVGPISDMREASLKASALVSKFPYLSWTGKWNTTRPNEMSIIEVECIKNKEGNTEWIVEVEPRKMEPFKINHPGLEFMGKWSTTKPISMSVICVKSLGKTLVEIGPIWDQQDAVIKANGFVAKYPYLRWTGQWQTTITGRMSVIEVECIKDPSKC